MDFLSVFEFLLRNYLLGRPRQYSLTDGLFESLRSKKMKVNLSETRMNIGSPTWARTRDLRINSLSQFCTKSNT